MNKITEVQKKIVKLGELHKEVNDASFSSESKNYKFVISSISDDDFTLLINSKRKDLVKEVTLNSTDIIELKRFLSDVLDEQKEKEDLVSKAKKQKAQQKLST